MKLIFVGIVKFCIGEEPEYRPYYPSRAGIFSLFRNSDRLAGTFHHKRPHLLKTGFFRQVRKLKIQRKNPGTALRIWVSLQKVKKLKLSFKKSDWTALHG
jgi:hypothetical protein